MVRISVIVQLCAAGFALAQAAAAPAGRSEVFECPRGQGYTPAVPAIPSGDKPVTTTAPATQAQPIGLPASAAYAEPVRKTFFAYLAAPERKAGGNAEAGSPEASSLLQVSFFDHAAGTVPRPAILPFGEDASVTPTGVSLALDEQGHVWVCSSAPGRPTVLFKSAKPHDVSAFTRQAGPPLADARLYHAGANGFLLIGLGEKDGGSVPCFATSPDGQTWAKPQQLAEMDADHSLLTAVFKGKTGAPKVGVAIAAWPAGKGPLAATNLYYIETPDAGRTWQGIRRSKLDLPIRGNENAVLVWDYRSIRWTVYLKDMEFDSVGNPSIVYLGGRGGTGQSPLLCTWTIARWVGREWETNGVIPAAGPFDATAFQIQPDRSWLQVIARNSPAPRQPHEPVVLWSSNDQGRSWFKQSWFSEPPADHHALVRPVNASPELWALWITGQADAGRLRFLNGQGDAMQLPAQMTGADAKPELVPATHPKTQPQ